MKNPAEVVAVYFPSYHRDELYDRWYGPGWNEWWLVEQARPLFDGHEQPKRCAWGAFDEADPTWMEKQIDLAADHGITAFLFDWYWYGGQKFLHRALEDGFLKARNRHRLKFFIMWANHTWGVFPACREIFRGPTGFERQTFGQALAFDQPLLEIRHTLPDLERVTEYCCEHYFREPNYLHLDGDPLFSFWHWPELEEGLGGSDSVAEGFARMRHVARRAGFKGLHLLLNVANYENPGTILCWWPALIDRIQRCGGDSVFGYNVARTPGYAKLPNDRPLVPYSDVMESHREVFRQCEGRDLPFHPTATVGFDNTPRWHRGAQLPVDFRRLGYEPIVVGNTPARFGETARVALDVIARADGPRLLLVNAWNEWTEGNYLLPDQHHGAGYLKALSEAVKR